MAAGGIGGLWICVGIDAERQLVGVFPIDFYYYGIMLQQLHTEFDGGAWDDDRHDNSDDESIDDGVCGDADNGGIGWQLCGWGHKPLCDIGISAELYASVGGVAGDRQLPYMCASCGVIWEFTANAAD